MATFNVPRGPQIRTKTLSNFLGVDFTSIMVDEHRFSDGKNFTNNNGYLETRPGYSQVGTTFTGLKINGVWNIDQPSDMFIIYAGTKLYSTSNTFGNVTELMSELPDVIAEAFFINNYLIILNGTRTIVYGYFDTTWKAVYLDTVGYIPTTSISRSPDGTGSVSYEDINLIQPIFTNTFIGTTTDTIYRLDTIGLDTDYTPLCYKLKTDGTWEEITEITPDYTNGTVTFATSPGESVIDGYDNIKIIAKKTVTANISNINKCTIGCLYGYASNRNRLFVSGNSDYSNVDWYSKDEQPLYFPSGNYNQIGTEPIVGYIVLNDGTLAVLKSLSDTDSTIYYREGVLFNGLEAFKITEGSKSIGCISGNASDNLLNDPLILSENGVYGISSQTDGGRFANERSYYVRNKLIAETNLNLARAIVNGNKYYLSVNGHMYVCDSRYKSNIIQSTTGAYSIQYEWYYWDNIPARVLFNYNSDLFFGTTDGKLFKFDNDLITDNGVNIDDWVDTSYLDFGTISVAKTIKETTVVSKPTVDSEYTLYYVTEDGEEVMVTKQYSTIDYPRTLKDKTKIKKFMFIKFRIKGGSGNKMNFYQIGFKYTIAGNYRGE